MEAKELMEQCRGRWQDLLQTLGGLSRVQLGGKHGPCPMCGGRDRYRFENLEGKGTWICNNCTGGRREDGANLLMRLKGWNFSELASELERSVGTAKRHVATARTSNQSQLAAMESIWYGAEPIEVDSPAGVYLAGRGISPGRYPVALRYHHGLWHPKAQQKLPAMVARLDGPKGEIGQLHKTFLSPDGAKADIDPVRMLHKGPFLDGASVRFGKPNGVLGIAEGIETALSAALSEKHAVWAAINAQMLMKWSPPPGPTKIRIFGDNDKNYTGQSKAFALANRLAMQNRDLEIEVLIPDDVGTDWNDVASGEML